jgi:hypothetical protein
MKNSLLFSFILLFTITTSNLWAQDRTVSGKVTSSEDGSTLPGVTIVLRGTSTGTVTDIDGNYKITLAGDGGTLVYSSHKCSYGIRCSATSRSFSCGLWRVN